MQIPSYSKPGLELYSKTQGYFNQYLDRAENDSKVKSYLDHIDGKFQHKNYTAEGHANKFEKILKLIGNQYNYKPFILTETALLQIGQMTKSEHAEF